MGMASEYAVKHGCVSPSALDQPVVATCILAGVTVIISEAAWMEVRFGPLIQSFVVRKGGRRAWPAAAIGPQIPPELHKCGRGGLVKPIFCTPTCSHHRKIPSSVALPGETGSFGSETRNRWADNCAVAQRYGKSQIFGCDISPIQPAYVWDNVFFSADDFEEEWTDYPENAFDYIHMRYTAFSIKDPAALLHRVMKYDPPPLVLGERERKKKERGKREKHNANKLRTPRHLKPGGYIEFQEMTYWPRSDDNTLTETTPYAFRDFCYYVQLGVAALGLDLHMINRLPQGLRDAGFDDVTEARHKLPIGRWARDRRQRQKGIWFLRMILMEGLSAIAKRPLTQGLGWKAEQVEMFLVDVRKSLNDTSVHAYFPFTVVYGRKPLGAGAPPAGAAS